MMENDNKLVSGILDEAKARADKIIRDAEEEAGFIKKDGIEEAARLTEAEWRSVRLRENQIAMKEESAKRSIDRLSELRNMDASFKKVRDEVDARIENLAKEGKLSSHLISWIVEAVIGLDRKSAVVSFSPRAVVTKEMLDEASTIVKRMTGSSVTLSLDDKMIGEIGVVVTSLDGKVSYENVVSVRIRRYLKEIRKIIQEENERQNSR